MKAAETASLFEDRRDLTKDTAWASVVYSLVPYLGILFVPAALIASLLLLFRAEADGRGYRYIVASMVVGLFQVFLWWLLYFIPTIGART